MLTGELPYGEVAPERASKKKFRYASTRQYNPLVPDCMDACLQKSVHPNPEKGYGLLSEFVTDFSKPNQSLLDKNASQPLIERNPLGFWRSFVLLEFILLVLLVLLFGP